MEALNKTTNQGLVGYQRYLYHHRFFYVLEILCIELISKFHNNLLVGHFDIKKI